ncbi:hypothetical protein BV22DRAFT_1131721 [Leucogyrophana mollusca]|uniref:Uncharacterized protein n=1 Tax=Leucogyrophana mollusca TaxID=85980 RepID=A0ACB8B8G6_9AGAM|nr:hypothetical protein BV22DRAFT_1131721 [Leucogyrophana mollusca]
MLRPVTVLQVLGAKQEYNRADLTIDDRPILNVLFVGHIISVELRSSTTIHYIFEDGTGRLSASRALNSPETGLQFHTPEYEAEHDETMFSGRYARICGKIKRFNHQTHLDVEIIHPVDYYEVMYHLLHVVTTTLTFERGRPLDGGNTTQPLRWDDEALDNPSDAMVICPDDNAIPGCSELVHETATAPPSQATATQTSPSEAGRLDATIPNLSAMSAVPPNDKPKGMGQAVNKTPAYTSFLGLSPDPDDATGSRTIPEAPFDVTMSESPPTRPVTPVDKGKGKAPAYRSFLGLSPDGDDEEVYSSPPGDPAPPAAPATAGPSLSKPPPTQLLDSTTTTASGSHIMTSSAVEIDPLPGLPHSTTTPPHNTPIFQPSTTSLDNFEAALRIQSPPTAKRLCKYASLTPLQREIILFVHNAARAHPEGVSGIDISAGLQPRCGQTKESIL